MSSNREPRVVGMSELRMLVDHRVSQVLYRPIHLRQPKTKTLYLYAADSDGFIVAHMFANQAVRMLRAQPFAALHEDRVLDVVVTDSLSNSDLALCIQESDELSQFSVNHKCYHDLEGIDAPLVVSVFNSNESVILRWNLAKGGALQNPAEPYKISDG